MIDIVGYIKVDESKPERVRQLIACIRSYAFLKESAYIHLILFTPSRELVEIVQKELDDFNHVHILQIHRSEVSYGAIYTKIISECKNDFVLNFMEDQFMMCDNPNTIANLLGFMRVYKADVCKASFFHVEQNSKHGINAKTNVPGLGMVYDNTAENHVAYCKHYGERYYIGVNFFTTRAFALKFWDRQLGEKPHPYEIVHHDPSWQHRCVIPHFELQAAIEDDHGEPGTSLLQRPDAKKFWDIYNSIT